MNHPKLVFTMGGEDGARVAQVLAGKGDIVARVLGGQPMDRMVSDALDALGRGETVLVPIEEMATGWRAPEGTEVLFSDAVMTRHPDDCALVEEARMRSPEWSMTLAANVLEEGLDMALADVDDAPLRALENEEPLFDDVEMSTGAETPQPS